MGVEGRDLFWGTYSKDSFPSRAMTIIPGRANGLLKSRITWPVISSVAGMKTALLGTMLKS